ncbi:MAG: hypothetical protein AAF611_22090 [Bacteroidota bacterium]
MNQKIKFTKATEKDKFLYTCLGEALCAVQILEDAVSHSIVMKKIEPEQKKAAETLLNKQRKYTLSKVIKIVKEESLLPKSLEIQLSEILSERNWLVHHCITENKENYKSDIFYNKISEKTKAIVTKAQMLQVSIELDLIDYAETKGKNMANVKSKMSEYYGIIFQKK